MHCALCWQSILLYLNKYTFCLFSPVLIHVEQSCFLWQWEGIFKSGPISCGYLHFFPPENSCYFLCFLRIVMHSFYLNDSKKIPFSHQLLFLGMHKTFFYPSLIQWWCRSAFLTSQWDTDIQRWQFWFSMLVKPQLVYTVNCWSVKRFKSSSLYQELWKLKSIFLIF